MKLFSLPDGVVDRLDRAQWLTLPFDLAWEEDVGGECTPPTVPTLVVTDNGDGTGGIATISDGDAGSVNLLFYATHNDPTTTFELDSRTGNGTIAISLPVGHYLFQVEATNAEGLSSFSNIDAVIFSDGDEPIVERIFQKVLVRLEAVTVGGVLRAKSGTGLVLDHRKIVVIQKDAEKNDEYSFPNNPPAQGWTQPFEINVLIKPSEGSTTADDQTLNRFFSDAIIAICTPSNSWHNWDGLAVNSEWETTQTSITDTGKFIVKALLLNVFYRVSENDPYVNR